MIGKIAVRIGIDVHICRTSETGIYTFIWNTIERLKALPDAPQLTMVLYGPGTVEEPPSVARMKDRFGATSFMHYWTRVSPWLASRQGVDSEKPMRRMQRVIDRRIMLRLWRKLGFGSTGIWRYAAAPFQSHKAPRWWNELDLVHHTAGLLLPMHPRANVLTINDLIPHHFKHQYKSELQWFGESFDRAREMDAILVYSEHTKADVIDVLGVDPDRIHVVPLAAHHRFRPIDDRGAVGQVLAKYGIEDQSYLLHVGSLEPRKNLVRLVEAFYELIVAQPRLPHKLVFSGPRFSTYQPIFEAIDNLRMQDRVSWLGAVPFDDLPALMNGAAVFVYPSFYEGFGLPPLEAMACGTPVIASRASSVPEVVGEAGLLVDPYRVKELTNAMQLVLNDPTLRLRMRAEGLERASSFSWDRAARQTLDIYRGVLAKPRTVIARTEAARTPTRSQSLVNEWLFNRLADQLDHSDAA